MNGRLLYGAPVAEKINGETREKTEKLKRRGVFPCLSVVRVGEKPDDIYYENALLKKADTLGISVRKVTLHESVSEETLCGIVKKLSAEESVHGILIMRPLPKKIDSGRVSASVNPAKDVDGITPASLYGVFAGENTGYAPCTARACMEILDYYEIPLTGKNAVVIGRSLVIGRPAAMLLTQKNATVTVCHTKTENLPLFTKNADIIVTSAGKAKSLTRDHVSGEQIVIDVGMNADASGRMSGDADFDSIVDSVSAITPVPGGVGSVTTAVLLNNTVRAAEILTK